MTEDAENKTYRSQGTGQQHAARWMNFFARVISGLWAGFWIFFVVASSADYFKSRGDASLGRQLIPIAFIVILLLLAFTAWRWVKIGRIVLPLAGVAVLIAYPIMAKNFSASAKAFVMVALGLPPLSAGALLIASGRIERSSGA
jgi:hypothetical protein